ncbi:MAG: nucleotidyl transferase AbiEii/AbiGii toxin family protein [Caulobacteraceae bacterium]|nr:nucleotidyl transferase AbiEii/AbiGii toxin family protein [Caulobacteraceae bacterium]
MGDRRRNVAASVRSRLLSHAKATGLSFDQVLTRFVLERLLFRLAASQHADRFVLKGAMLLTSWFDDPLRPTRDIDFLGYGDPAPEAMKALFAEVLAMAVEDDGVIFRPDEITTETIRDDVEYGGVRLKTVATIENARVTVTVDIGFGDATTPAPESFDYPVLLGFPSPRLRGYARETVIAEKFQAMVSLGKANTRIKDFYDVWALRTHFAFEDERLATAIRATFDRRQTEIPVNPPTALTDQFSKDPGKRALWAAFSADLAGAPAELEEVIESVRDFLMPRAEQARGLGS